MITRPVPPAPRTLRALAERLGARLEGVEDPEARIADLAEDSRRVEPGSVFFARRGTRADGAQFVREARGRGAVAVVADRPVAAGVPCLRVVDAAEALRIAADAWFGRPQDALDLAGVTGTKGKTTTTWLLAAALRGTGRPAALLGTVHNDLGGGIVQEADQTTAGPLELRRLLAQARDAGAGAAALEVSSHALQQGRTDGLDFRVGVFTNLASDHLDYHRTLDAYFEAKSRLFSGLRASATAVLNREDPAWGRLAARCRGHVLTYGFSPEADFRASRVSLAVERTRFRLTTTCWGETEVETPLVGRHNVLNLLAAVAAASALGVDPVHAAAAASALPGVRGRLERVEEPAPDLPADLHAFVDYAHTEASLREVLSFLRTVGAEPLVCVVGCGGDRDRTKRPLMARTAAELADRVVFTSDNPRTEDPDAILAEMLAGVPAGLAEKCRVVSDRRDAIAAAVREAPPGATVLVAGKGHETYQVVGTAKRPFDDAQEVRRALALRASLIASREVRTSRPAS